MIDNNILKKELHTLSRRERFILCFDIDPIPLNDDYDHNGCVCPPDNWCNDYGVDCRECCKWWLEKD